MTAPEANRIDLGKPEASNRKKTLFTLMKFVSLFLFVIDAICSNVIDTT